MCRFPQLYTLSKVTFNLQGEIKMKNSKKDEKAPVRASRPGLFEWLAGTTK